MTLVQLARSLSSSGRATTMLLGLARQPGAPNTKEIETDTPAGQLLHV